MKLSDVMSGLGLGIYPILAMGLFLLVFVGVLVRVVRRHARSEMEHAAMLPLADERPVLPGAGAADSGWGPRVTEARS